MLSRHEQQELQRIEQWFEATDPYLADDLKKCSATGAAAHAPGLMHIATYVVALGILVPGIISVSLPLIFFGVIALIAAGTVHITLRDEDQ